MKKITSLILAFLIIFSNIFLLASCGAKPPEPPDQRLPSSIVIPGRLSYSRPTVSFESVVYQRPDIISCANAVKDVANAISNGADFDTGLELIKSIEDGYTAVNTMYTVAEINYMRNSSDIYWAAEYEFVTTAYPSFSEALEDLFVACAQSPERSRFENEYFMYSLEEYVNGGIYTDRVVELMQREAQLESDYTDISEANVSITYLGMTDTYENIMKAIEDQYGSDSAEYARAEENCYTLLYTTLMNEWRPIFIELVKVRRELANELGVESYTDYAYSAMGYEYTPEQMTALLKQIKLTVYPVFSTLYERAFRSFFYNNEPSESLLYLTVNNLYDLYSSDGGIMDEAYSYLLKCGLYDIEEPSPGRYNGAFTTHIESLDAPFLFMTTEGYVTDYLTLSHEYGHFLDSYINGRSNVSLDLSEISSQAMELMTIPKLKGVISDEEVQFLEYYQMYNALNILLTQGFYSIFEHLVYQLEYDEITEENLDKATEEASRIIFGNVYYNDFGEMLIQHTVVYPHYVQSYCTSLISSLEIFFTEEEKEGEGMDIYLDLITRDSEGYMTYLEELEAAGLSSPFDKKTLKYVVDSIHYRILGSHYFKEMGDTNAA